MVDYKKKKTSSLSVTAPQLSLKIGDWPLYCYQEKTMTIVSEFIIYVRFYHFQSQIS